MFFVSTSLSSTILVLNSLVSYSRASGLFSQGSNAAHQDLQNSCHYGDDWFFYLPPPPSLFDPVRDFAIEAPINPMTHMMGSEALLHHIPPPQTPTLCQVIQDG